MPPAGRNKKGWSVAVREADPSFGDLIHLDVVSPDGTRPWGRVTAFNGDDTVYMEYNGHFDGYIGGPDAPYTLGPTPAWSGGAATGLAEVCEHVNGEFRVRASVQFQIAA